jgi:16S rRNA (guanine(966)-N(2))-methyltransferase RsmD
MDNQRRTPGPSSTVDRNKNFRKPGERSGGYSKYPARESNFQPRGERFQRPEGQRSEGLQPRGDRFTKRPGGFSPRNDRFQGKDRFQSKGKEPAWKSEPKIKIVSDLQLTDGKHRGKYIKTSTSPKLKVTSRQIREAVFKVLFRRVRARRFLDLCAGPGTIGLEAITRGSIVSTFVERSAKMCSFIRKNMESLEIKPGHGEVVEMEVMPFLKRIAKRRRQWDVVYLSQAPGAEFDDSMKFLSRGTAIAPGGALVIEHPAEVFMPERLGVLHRWRVIVQGATAVSFFERK